MKVKRANTHLCDGGEYTSPWSGWGPTIGGAAVGTSGAQILLCILFWVVLIWRRM